MARKFLIPYDVVLAANQTGLAVTMRVSSVLALAEEEAVVLARMSASEKARRDFGLADDVIIRWQVERIEVAS